LHSEHIIPRAFNRRVAESLAEAVATATATIASEVAQRERGVRSHEPATASEPMS
jgi:malic enzyme